MPRGGTRPGAGRPRKHDVYERGGFTTEELNELLESPHISCVSRKTVSYTREFKEMFWQRYCDGVEPMRIFEESGLNTQVLDRTRINGLIKTLRRQLEKGVPFGEGSEPRANQPEKKFDFPTPPRKPKNSKLQSLGAADISKMYHQVAYLSQEMEFIKKIILAGRNEKCK